MHISYRPVTPRDHRQTAPGVTFFFWSCMGGFPQAWDTALIVIGGPGQPSPTAWRASAKPRGGLVPLSDRFLEVLQLQLCMS